MLLPTERIAAFPYTPGPWYGKTSASTYTLLPAGGAGIWNSGLPSLGAGVPCAAIRAQELAGLVTPGKALNDERWKVAPRSSKVPLKVISPAMPCPVAPVRELPPGPGLVLLAADPLAADPLAADGPDAAADEPAGAGAEPPDELQAARPAASVRPIMMR